jgi:Tfp pilus assembly protein PilX
MPLIRRLRPQHGFTTVTLMGTLAIGSLLVAGGFAAVNPDIGLSRKDQDYKQAYGAAEAGVQWYLSSLARDNSFYTKCTNVPDPNAQESAPVNQRWNGSGADPRVWRNLTGSTEAQYTIELLPASGYAQCVEGDQFSMVDPSGNMRIRATGRSRGEARSVIVTLRRRNFIDFIYFTHFETLDPLAYATSSQQEDASEDCAVFREERSGCTEIQFAANDYVKGPLHTNDSIIVCGSPTFGRVAQDAIELNGEDPGYDDAGGGCANSPDFQGTVVYPAGQMELPPSNQTLQTIAQTGGNLFQGKTQIVLDDSSMQVKVKSGSWQTLALPSNGVIYVKNESGCSVGYARNQTYNNPSACGDAWVKGDYSSNLTIAADNDVIVDGNLTRNSDSLLLGLIANNFVRVYHPLSWDYNDWDDDDDDECSNGSGSLTDPQIDAAILALNHSFIVDNWYCGDDLGDLEVNGAIAQRFRGPVGTSGGTGYIKDYNYNDRLRYREPPYFLDPVQSAWRVARQNEQVPATK